MSEASRSRVTITLGRSGQVVKRAGDSLGGSFADEHQAVGTKRPVQERLGSNKDSSAEFSNKRLRRDGRSTNAFDGMHLNKDDLRYKIMQKKKNVGDLRNILSRPAQSSTNSVTTRDSMVDPKDRCLSYLNGRQHIMGTTDGRDLTPVSRRSSLHIPEFRAGHAPDPRKHQIPEVRDGGRSILEAQNARRPVPEARPLSSLTRMESGTNSYSPWTLDRLRRRSPDESLPTSRGLTAPKKDEILQRRIPATVYGDARTSAYMSKDPYDISRPTSSSLMTKMAPPVGQMKTMAPVPSGSLVPKTSYPIDDRVTVDSFLHSLGLEKFAVSFKAEEVDMYSLKRMTESDLKEMGIPMGPRKKILLALQPRLRPAV